MSLFTNENPIEQRNGSITCFLQLGELLAVDQVTQPSFEDIFSKHSQ